VLVTDVVSIMNVAETNACAYQVQQHNHTTGQNKMKEERDLIERNPILFESETSVKVKFNNPLALICVMKYGELRSISFIL
jgi:hypothetical protein